MKNKNFSKLELKHKLENSLNENNIALDCLENWIHFVEDRLGYNENDVELKEALEVLKYLQFCMLYLDKMYSQAYKEVGGKL